MVQAEDYSDIEYLITKSIRDLIEELVVLGEKEIGEIRVKLGGI